MKLHVNGETRAVHEEISLAELLEQSELAPQRVDGEPAWNNARGWMSPKSAG